MLLNVGEASKPYLWVPKVTEVALLRLGNFVSCGLCWGLGWVGWVGAEGLVGWVLRAWLGWLVGC